MQRERTILVRRVVACITEGHRERPAHARGLCGGCYNGYDAEVKAGTVKWSELEELGLSLPLETAAGRIERAREAKKSERV